MRKSYRISSLCKFDRFNISISFYAQICTIFPVSSFSTHFIFDLVEQKIDGMCLKEGLSDAELNCCKVVTVGDKKMIRRKLQELVGMF